MNRSATPGRAGARTDGGDDDYDAVVVVAAKSQPFGVLDGYGRVGRHLHNRHVDAELHAQLGGAVSDET